MGQGITKTDPLLVSFLKQPLFNFSQDAGCADYAGCSFQHGGYRIKFRKAKNTPKKEGVFTTLWKRNFKGETIPFDEKDPFDFYIIMAERNSKSGYFVFPSPVLTTKGILSDNGAGGKRGFRLYPPWSATESRQAQKTQTWQSEYFISTSELEKFEAIIHKQ